MSTKKRNKISIKDKYEIIIKLKSGVKRKLIIQEYGLKSFSHLTRILKNEQNIIRKYESQRDKSNQNSFSIREAKHPEVENDLILWIQQMRDREIKLSADTILKKAEEIAIKRKIYDFKPTVGYLAGLKRRHSFLFNTKKRETTKSVNSMVTDMSPKLEIHDLSVDSEDQEMSEEEEEISEEETTDDQISNSDALDFINGLQIYFSQIGINSFGDQLNQMKHKVMENIIKTIK